MLFIYALGDSSGAHFNPLISFATYTTYMTSFPRFFIYAIAQIAGMLSASYLTLIALNITSSQITTPLQIEGMSWGGIPTSSAFVIEFLSSFFLLIVAYGTAFDPNNGKSYGQLLPPLFIGIALFFVIFGTGRLFPKCSGAGVNPARALGPAIASGIMDMVWIYVVGPFSAAAVHAFVYNLLPPKFYEKSLQKKKVE